MADNSGFKPNYLKHQTFTDRDNRRSATSDDKFHNYEINRYSYHRWYHQLILNRTAIGSVSKAFGAKGCDKISRHINNDVQ